MERSPAMRRAIAIVFVLAAACDPGVRLGAACEYSSECPAPLVCGFGRCRAECRRNRDCPLDATCLLDQDGAGRCSLEDDPDCRSGAPCASGLACFAGECVNACETVAECPPDAVCVPSEDGRARCVREDRAPDAGPIDAGTLDAGPGDAAGDAGPSCSGGACVLEIAAGGRSTCARVVGGAVWCWGADALGDGATHAACAGGVPCSTTPVRVRIDEGGGPVPLQGALAIAAGNSSACAILDGGGVACWGMGWVGQLGHGGEDGSVARRVRGVGGTGYLDHVVALHPGNEVWIAERDLDPRAVGWGERGLGVLLDGGGTGGAWAPVVVAAPSFEEIVAGGWHGCVRTTGGIECWGRNVEGEAGGATAGAGAGGGGGAAIPHLMGVVGLVGAARGTCGLRSDDIVCWGSQLVLAGGTTMPECFCSRSGVTIDRAADARYRAIFSSPSSDYVYALDDLGRAWCWGLNDVGGVCDPSATYSVDAPYRRAGLPGPIDAIATGAQHACALVAGEAWCWGANLSGQLGRGGATSAIETTPMRVAIGP